MTKFPFRAGDFTEEGSGVNHKRLRNRKQLVILFQNVRAVVFQGQKPCHDKKDEVHKALTLYEELLNKNEFVAGNHLTLAGDKI